MFVSKKKREKRIPIKQRAASISATKLEQKNQKEKKPWLWEPDEITSFGNRRLLRKVLLPDRELDDELDPEEEAEEIHDWLAVLITDAYDETVEIYKDYTRHHAYWAHLYLHPEKYPNQGYPNGKPYTWKVPVENKRTGSRTEKDVVLKVSDYIDNVFQFFVDQMENDAVFPPADHFPFPVDFTDHAKELNTLLFRVLAIMFSNEDESVHVIAKPLKAILRKVLYYSWQWDLLDEREMKCISYLVEPVRKQYKTDYEMEMYARSNSECLD